jgi:hypothetical protein
MVVASLRRRRGCGLSAKAGGEEVRRDEAGGSADRWRRWWRRRARRAARRAFFAFVRLARPLGRVAGERAVGDPAADPAYVGAGWE